MMEKKKGKGKGKGKGNVLYILPVTLFFLLAVAVSAQTQDYGEWRMDNATTDNVTSVNTGTYLDNLTNINNPVTGIVGKIDEAYDYDGTGSYSNLTSFSTITDDTDGTLCTWFYTNDVTYGIIVGSGNPGISGSNADYVDLETHTNGYIRMFFGDGAGTLTTIPELQVNAANNSWNFYCIQSDGTSHTVYYNGNNVTSSLVYLAGSNNGVWYDDFQLANWRVADLFYAASSQHLYGDVSVDNLCYFDDPLNIENMNNLWNDGNGAYCGQAFAAVADTTPPVITNIQPANTSHSNDIPLIISFNATDDSAGNVSCILSELTTIYDQETIAGGGYYTLEFPSTVNMTETHTFDISCYDNTPSNNSQSEVWELTIDTINPFDNLRIQIPDGSIFYEDVNITVIAENTNLYGHNVTVYNSLGDIMFSQEVINISAAEHNITIPIDISWGVDTYTVISNESDDHTARNIPDWVVAPNLASKRLVYDTGHALIDVRLDSAYGINAGGQKTPIIGLLNKIATNKRFDRYNFEYGFNPHAPFANYEFNFIINTDKDIYVRQDTEYKGHIVVGNDHWIDFEGTSETVLVDRIDENTVYITVYSTTTELLFESIGALNHNSTTTTFIIPSPSVQLIECDESGYQSCDLLVFGDNVTGFRTTCQYSDAAIISLNKTSTALFTDEVMARSGDLFTYSYSEVVDSSTYTIETTCSNDADSVTSVDLFTPSITTPASVSTLSAFPYETFTVFIVTVILVIFVGFAVKSNISKKGGGLK